MFWCKTISGNGFTPHCVFGCTWKIEFSGKPFQLTVNIMALTWKIFYISIFTSNHFRTSDAQRERARRESTGGRPAKLRPAQIVPLPPLPRSCCLTAQITRRPSFFFFFLLPQLFFSLSDRQPCTDEDRLSSDLDNQLQAVLHQALQRTSPLFSSQPTVSFSFIFSLHFTIDQSNTSSSSA